MAEFKRSQRVAQLLKQEISGLITRGLKDPLIGFATVTKVKLADDLSFARVYISILGEDASKEDTIKGLERAKKFIRTELGHRTGLKFIPELNFYLDDSAEYAQTIETLLKKIHDDDR